MPGLTLERLQEVLEYNPESGVLIWKVATGKKTQLVGKTAGSVGKRLGYVEVGIDGKSYLGHRLAWFLMMGSWPENGIDHINRCPSDNRWCNLRAATQTQNNANSKTRAKSGFRGVIPYIRDKSKWVAHIKSYGKTRNLGIFDTPEQAHAAYCKAAKEAFGEYATLE